MRFDIAALGDAVDRTRSIRTAFRCRARADVYAYFANFDAGRHRG